MIKTNLNQIRKEMTDFEKNQIPYASSVTLNNTAEIAMKAMERKITDDFNITASWNKVGGKHGIRKISANKKKLEVEIFIPESNTWLYDHESGNQRHGMHLIPTNGFKELFPNIRTNRAIKKKAKTLLSNKSRNRIFEAPIKKGSSTKAIFQRVKGKTIGSRRLKSTKTGRLLKAKRVFNRQVIPIFIIKNSVQENPILQFRDTVEKVFDKNFDKQFNKAFEYAMFTASK